MASVGDTPTSPSGLNLSVKAIEQYVTTILRKLALADQNLIDRRVTAALPFVRAQTASVDPQHSSRDTEG